MQAINTNFQHMQADQHHGGQDESQIDKKLRTSHTCRPGIILAFIACMAAFADLHRRLECVFKVHGLLAC